MLFLITTQLLLLIAAEVLGESQPRLYPDFSCHPGYNNATNNDWEGEGWILDAMAECKQSSCFKNCVLSGLDILSNRYCKLSSEIQIGKQLAKKLNIKSAFEIARKIHSNCSALAGGSFKLTCDERAELFKCIEDATQTC